MTEAFDDIWHQFDHEQAIETGTSVPPPEFFGRIIMPDHCLDGCPGQLVELTASSVDGCVRHEAVIRVLEKRGIFQVGYEVTVPCENWKDA